MKYSTVVVIIGLFSMFVSNFGLSTIISIAAPILSLVYPVIVVLIILFFAKNKIHNANIYKGAAFGLNCIVPAIIGGIVGALIKEKKKA